MTLRSLSRTGLRLVLLAVVCALAGTGPSSMTAAAASQDPSDQSGVVMRIRIEGGGQRLTATLEDNATARDFASLLPLSLTLRDHGGIERIADLPRRLSREGAPAGIDPEPGDITYYAPWGNLAIFHGDFGYSRGLIRLGRTDRGGDLQQLRAMTDVTMDRLMD